MRRARVCVVVVLSAVALQVLADQVKLETPKIPADTPEQAALRKELQGKGQIYLPGGNRLYVINADGSNLRMLKDFGAKESTRFCQVSWDGKWVAVTVTLPKSSERQGQELWVVKYDGSEAKMVFHDPEASGWARVLYCAWSPASTWVVIAHGKRVDAVHRETGEVKKLLEAKKGGMTYLSSDRQGTFYFWAVDLQPGGNAFAIDKDCNVIKELFRGAGALWCHPRVSPDGTKMTRKAHRKWAGGPTRIQIRDFADGQWREWRFVPTTEREDMPRGGNQRMPFWSPDGKHLGFGYNLSGDDAKRLGFKTVVAICRIEGGPIVWLLASQVEFGYPAWGPEPETPGSTEQGE